MTTGLWVLIGAVLLALAVGGWRAVSDGRFARTGRIGEGEAEPATEGATGGAAGGGAGSVWAQVAASVPDVEPGERATLLQFSTAFCAPCRATRRTLAEVAELVPGVAHVEVDAEHHLELVRRLGVLRTPTTLVLDGAGREVTRAAGAPRKEQVLGALGDVV